MMDHQEMVLIRGLPGSGKSTLALEFAARGYEHHEADRFMFVGGKYEFAPSKLNRAHALCLRHAKRSLARGKSCVVANTFSRLWEMQPYLEAARRAGVPVRIITAQGAWENTHDVPAAAIEMMRAQWENT